MITIPTLSWMWLAKKCPQASNLSRNNTFSSNKDARELGFKARSFEKSIRDTVSWLAAKGKIKIKSRNTTGRSAIGNVQPEK
jgi:nucleoside-diphosphate-sugar epimerase